MGDMADYTLSQYDPYTDGYDEEWNESAYVGYSKSLPGKARIKGIVKETPKAWLLGVYNFEGNYIESWFPKSICSINLKAHTILAPVWLFDRKNMI